MDYIHLYTSTAIKYFKLLLFFFMEERAHEGKSAQDPRKSCPRARRHRPQPRSEAAVHTVSPPLILLRPEILTLVGE